jgi:type VI secretion system protein ImpC
MKTPTEIAISDRREFELSNLGFMPLLHSKNRDFAVFMGSQSCQKPKTYFDPAANANAELSTKTNYLLSVSRFAHYLKVMARDKIGSFMEVSDCEKWLNSWINNYVVGNPESVSDEIKKLRVNQAGTTPWLTFVLTSNLRHCLPACAWWPKFRKSPEPFVLAFRI